MLRKRGEPRGSRDRLVRTCAFSSCPRSSINCLRLCAVWGALRGVNEWLRQQWPHLRVGALIEAAMG